MMGEVELNLSNRTLIVHSNIITYGNYANLELTEQIREEIETMWNAPAANIRISHSLFTVRFHITATLRSDITEMEVLQNTDPRNNYFRIEEFAHGNISFVDGLRCNTGYFKLENLYRGSTTAAHEYGHTLGLDHPAFLDIRGRGVPGIMYPRGTLVDPSYQYDPTRPAGVTGGTMHPMFRKVYARDIEDLNFHRLLYKNNRTIIGDFTNIYHWNHAETDHEFFSNSIISG